MRRIQFTFKQDIVNDAQQPVGGRSERNNTSEVKSVQSWIKENVLFKTVIKFDLAVSWPTAYFSGKFNKYDRY